MKMTEAFCAEFYKVHGDQPNPNDINDLASFQWWQAACEYQKQKDAEICRDIGRVLDANHAHTSGAYFAEAILKGDE